MSENKDAEQQLEENKPSSRFYPDVVTKAIENLSTDLTSIDEESVRKLIDVNSTDEKLRLSFWREFDNSVQNKVKMSTSTICERICSPQYFRDKFLKMPERVAFLLLPPKDYLLELEVLLQNGLDRLKDIVQIPIKTVSTSKDGIEKTEYNTSAASVILKAIKEIADRVQGTSIQRSEHKELRVTKDVDKLNDKELDEKINELQENLKIKQSQVKNIVEAEFTTKESE